MDYVVIGAIALAVFGALGYLSSPAAKGARGEARVRRRLAADLAPLGCLALHDLTLPTAEGTTQIDHVVIARCGVFVIETKTMAGRIFGDARQARWTQVLPGHKTRFQNPLRQNYKHIKVIEACLGLAPERIHSVVAFVGAARPKTEMPENVLWGPRALSRYLRLPRPEIWTQAEIAALAARLQEGALPPRPRNPPRPCCRAQGTRAFSLPRKLPALRRADGGAHQRQDRRELSRLRRLPKLSGHAKKRLSPPFNDAKISPPEAPPPPPAPPPAAAPPLNARQSPCGSGAPSATPRSAPPAPAPPAPSPCSAPVFSPPDRRDSPQSRAHNS